MEDDAGDYADGDASHRLLDRRLNKAKDREAEELAASFVTRYGKSKYDAEAGSEEWAPKALLMPGVNDASIWGLKCKVSPVALNAKRELRKLTVFCYLFIDYLSDWTRTRISSISIS